MASAAYAPLPGRPNALVIESHVEGDRAVLAPRGELVRGCADDLAETLVALPYGVRKVELDMSGVVFMDTAGLQFLETLADHGHRHDMPVAIANWGGQPLRIMELAGLDTTDPLHTPAPAPHVPESSAVALERAEQLRLLQDEVEQLRQALASRPVIDQARGILMATHSCTSDEAWTILRQTSQLSNTKLRTVAAAVTASTGSDGTPPPEEIRNALRRAFVQLGR
ncbi:response regulator NasT [Streptomyces sp. LBL]|uniref:ANTAR domain-containing response regulator n=1 Tax=Streptomyces sp. LBL TaxID=2940562 RepID=UPI00247479F0|nr:ANTAR domain-containing protein [Streptomyces sp. LBL]MDH6627213.1 response regulator NasT [Streptomyces sp. LBL]